MSRMHGIHKVCIDIFGDLVPMQVSETLLVVGSFWRLDILVMNTFVGGTNIYTYIYRWACPRAKARRRKTFLTLPSPPIGRKKMAGYLRSTVSVQGAFCRTRVDVGAVGENSYWLRWQCRQCSVLKSSTPVNCHFGHQKSFFFFSFG